MSAKEVLFGADAVRVTLGPKARTLVLQRALDRDGNFGYNAATAECGDCMIAQLSEPSSKPEEMAA